MDPVDAVVAEPATSPGVEERPAVDELMELYQQLVVEHGQRPRNRGALVGEVVRRADGDNPLCGDQVTVYAEVDADERITAVRFEGHGCAISTASASLMTEAVTGLSLAEAEALFERFRAVMTEEADPDESAEGAPPLGKLEALVGVRAYPMRVKCATLSWHTLRAALAAGAGASADGGGAAEPVTTE